MVCTILRRQQTTEGVEHVHLLETLLVVLVHLFGLLLFGLLLNNLLWLWVKRVGVQTSLYFLARK
jgi:hypothetical protein